ncbi:NAD(P)-dependent oxidoreductase [Rhizobium wenxiniae]|uniref:Nucleoside-diphosphate-sugar epimerase n=1 Tax=Rhizobium wenxiniae TaxID=1737357 RepID=A0A7W9Y724_9HYPH|nr:SDR family oxidoreductase [Rhizobium wenxiniae]MBB6163027.1 nucleoside-diphosphate-sugar epimerase [Rhizobium wenxiniae]GGF93903.1 NAD(P)-dependent oxidoreductase [Rhizobium wenxiniae]
MTVMIFGCGYSGKAIAKAFAEKGFSVAGTVRTPEGAEALSSHHIKPYIFDGTAFGPGLLAELQNVTHLVQSIPPGKEHDPLLKLVSGRLAALCPKLEWIGYLSTVGVYGDHGGDWVTEETPGSPILGRSIERVDTEETWAEQGRTASIPVAALRLSGIYGPGRNAFVNLDRGTARRIIKKDQVFNRIRVEDIGSAAVFLAERNLAGIYNVTDDEPCAPQDVIAEAARLMGVEPPAEVAFETAEMTPMARSFYGANKRVSNEKIRALGFQFAFPNYRISLAQMWSENTWRG